MITAKSRCLPIGKQINWDGWACTFPKKVVEAAITKAKGVELVGQIGMPSGKLDKSRISHCVKKLWIDEVDGSTDLWIEVETLSTYYGKLLEGNLRKWTSEIVFRPFGMIKKGQDDPSYPILDFYITYISAVRKESSYYFEKPRKINAFGGGNYVLHNHPILNHPYVAPLADAPAVYVPPPAEIEVPNIPHAIPVEDIVINEADFGEP